MAMDKDRLADSIVTKIETILGFSWSPAERLNARKVWVAVADAVIQELDVNASINFSTTEKTAIVNTAIPSTFTGNLG